MIHKEDRTKNMYNAVAYEENNKEQCYFCDYLSSNIALAIN